jgi:hypothetical protein
MYAFLCQDDNLEILKKFLPPLSTTVTDTATSVVEGDESSGLEILVAVGVASSHDTRVYRRPWSNPFASDLAAQKTAINDCCIPRRNKLSSHSTRPSSLQQRHWVLQTYLAASWYCMLSVACFLFTWSLITRLHPWMRVETKKE